MNDHNANAGQPVGADTPSQPTQILDPLGMRLNGRQIIEASAGTGKTWTLAALYLRLVIGFGAGLPNEGKPLRPDQILVMTFTDAATAELRGRIRDRLAEAAIYFKKDSPASGDAFLSSIYQALSRDERLQAAERLKSAAQVMDQASIHTIHGWCNKMLQSHAFDSASMFEQKRCEDPIRLEMLAAQDYWRHNYYSLSKENLRALRGVGSSPHDLLEKIRPMWAERQKRPDVEVPEALAPKEVIAKWRESQDVVDSAERAARQAWIAHGDWAHATLMKAMKESLNGNTYRSASHQEYLDHMDEWANGEDADIDIIKKFSLSTLASKVKSGKTPVSDEFGVFALIDAFVEHHIKASDPAPELIAHASVEILKAYENIKSQRGEFDFQDLITRLYYAVTQPQSRLAKAIREHYPIALVDEFQDTDPWQYTSLESIYPDEAPFNTTTGLIMIGDPKQAIYGFRGADLQTYLRARGQAHAIQTLDGNFRSHTHLVNAVNHVFKSAKNAFGDIPYEPVIARNKQVSEWKEGDQSRPALTVWYDPESGVDSKASYIDAMAQSCATEITRLLNTKSAAPSDIAILVRDGAEARAIRSALTERSVRSVYMSEKESVFESEQAIDLWHVLCALAQPKNERLLKSAMSTRLWGTSWEELELLTQDERLWDEQIAKSQKWHTAWQENGILTMLHEWMHDSGVSRRLRDPSSNNQKNLRALTNVLHLGEWLQSSSFTKQSIPDIINQYELQLRNPKVSGETAQLRLESDAQLVQVITMHKSKGLQYPLVFIPFASAFRKMTEDEAAETIAEDIRLFYVALTRGQRATWLGLGRLAGELDGKNGVRSAVSRLLGRESADDLSQKLELWRSCSDIVVEAPPSPNEQVWSKSTKKRTLRDAKISRIQCVNAKWVGSFSAMVRNLSEHAAYSDLDRRWEDAQTDASSEEDDLADSVGAHQSFPAGSMYGTMLHSALEWQASNRWLISDRNENVKQGAIEAWQRTLQKLCTPLGLNEETVAKIDPWIKSLIDTPLPAIAQDFTISSLNDRSFLSEMDFLMGLEAVKSRTFDTMLRKEFFPGMLRPALDSLTLKGLMSGVIDLIFEVDGRYCLMDYKSNKLNQYTQAHMMLSMLQHRYDAQLAIYQLAIHRLLKHRLPDYDYDAHVGAAYYYYLRGVDTPDNGIFSFRPSKAFIESMDALFASGDEIKEAA